MALYISGQVRCGTLREISSLGWNDTQVPNGERRCLKGAGTPITGKVIGSLELTLIDEPSGKDSWSESPAKEVETTHKRID